MSITESVAEAQDIVQEVMMRLWDNRTEWVSITNMEVYSMVLAKNIALDKIKKSGFHSESIYTNKTINTLSNLHHPHEDIEKKEESAIVWKIIRLLPAKQQELIRLREIEELSYQEIANEMNITEAQVKINLFRARQKIKEIYTKSGYCNEH